MSDDDSQDKPEGGQPEGRPATQPGAQADGPRGPQTFQGLANLRQAPGARQSRRRGR